MSTSQIYYFLDEQKGAALSTGGGTWVFTTAAHYYLDNTAWPNFAVNRSVPQGTMSFTIDGTSIAIIGNTPGGDNELQRFTVGIDQNKPYNSTSYDTIPEGLTYKQWYQSPNLPAGTHTFTFSDMAAIGVDYIAVTPAPDTSLTGKTLIVDDTYKGIKYKGSWQTSKGQKYQAGTILPGYTFQNTTHRTSSSGDSFSFSYSGSNLTVYALFDWSQVGSYKISYTIDNGTPFSNSYTAQGNSTEGWLGNANFKLLDTGPLSSGIHTLNVTLTDCITQTLMIDYIAWQPDFPTLSAMPNATTSTTTTSTAGQTGTSQPSDGGGGGGGGSSNVGAIAGGVVGGLVALGLILGGLFLLWRRRRAAASSEGDQPYNYHQAPMSNMTYAHGASHSGATGGVIIPPGSGQRTPDPSYIVEPFNGLPTPGSDMPPSKRGMAPPSTPGTSFDYYNSSTHMGSPPSVAGSGFTSSASGTSPFVRMMSPMSESGSSSGGAGENVDDLRRQIHHLAQENASLSAMNAPPPYHSQ